MESHFVVNSFLGKHNSNIVSASTNIIEKDNDSMKSISANVAKSFGCQIHLDTHHRYDMSNDNHLV